VDNNGNVYIMEDRFNEITEFVKVYIHEIGHLKSKAGSKDFFPFTIEELDESGKFVENNTITPFLDDFRVCLNEIYNSKSNDDDIEEIATTRIGTFFKVIEDNAKTQSSKYFL
jgi:hypothetical protein